jgi:hypothetical protein
MYDTTNDTCSNDLNNDTCNNYSNDFNNDNYITNTQDTKYDDKKKCEKNFCDNDDYDYISFETISLIG